MSNLNAAQPPNELADRDTDRELVVRIRDGDLAAFERLFIRYSVQILRFAASMTGDEDAGKDVMQDVFQWVWEHRESWDPPPDVLAYLLTAARHRALNVQRSAKRRDDAMARYAHELHVAAADDPALPTDHLGHVAEAIRALPERQRAILFLRWQQGLSWEAVASALSVSANAARTQHSRTISALRRIVHTLLPEE